MNASTKHCELDPLPTWVLRKRINGLLPAITILVNRSLDCGMPNIYKHAVVKPLRKKGAKDNNKIIERAVFESLVAHATEWDLLDKYQFAYSKNNSCETALINVLDTARIAADDGKVTLLALMDMSAAFDTIDHSILLTRLSSLRLHSSVISWFQHYLEGRTCAVKCIDAQSQPKIVKYGVPQGSVLGPLLFVLYVRELGHIPKQNGVSYVMYADDLQLFTTTPHSEVSLATIKLEVCISEIEKWLSFNQLMMNPEKTEFIILGKKATIKKLPTTLSLQIGNTTIPPNTTVRNLGFIIDTHLTMEQHIQHVCRNCFFYLKAISRQRYFMDKHSSLMLMQAFILSRIDYCASLLASATSKQETHMQRVLNYAVRVVERLTRRESVKHHQHTIGWLPIKQRFLLRIALLVHSGVHTGQPITIRDMLTLKSSCMVSSSQTRSTDDTTLLHIPKTKSKIGDAAFSVIGPRTWNSIPQKIREIKSIARFKSTLMEHYFSCNS